MSNPGIKAITNQNTGNNSKDSSLEEAFCFKGHSYTITTLQIMSPDTDIIASQLQKKLSTTFNFFYKAPVIIDLKDLNTTKATINQPQIHHPQTANNQLHHAQTQHSHAPKLSMHKLKSILLANNLLPIAIINANIEQQQEAFECNLANLHSSLGRRLKQNLQLQANNENTHPDNTSSTEPIEAEPEIIATTSSTLITQNVRSGQQIYARGGDLIVTASVSQGAELLADGHIHIYGSLRGRALAGVNGDTNARIFCHKLEAELISIAGQYMLSEHIEKIVWGIPAQICLINENLHINKL